MNIENLPILLSILPFLVFLFLLFVRKTTLLKASLLTLFLYTLLAIFYWQIIGTFLYASFGKGVFVAVDILLIIFGAIFFLEILKDLKIIKNISHYLSGISKDYRIQVILIAWFFECFLEGTAGFGTPAAIAVPLLIGLGLPPIRALVVGLLGNSIPGIFGAAGTPIKVGFSTLNVSSVPQYAALFNIVGMIVPVFMLWIITAGRPNRKKEFIEALPFAIWSGVLFVGFSLLFLKLFGQEFPSILGSLAGMIVIILSIKLGIFVPKNKLMITENQEDVKTMSAFKSFLPYIILVACLIFGKILIGKIGFPIGIGFKHTFNLFNPGIIFIFVTLVVVGFWQSKKEIVFRSIKSAFRGAIIPFFVIASMLAMVEIMKNSGNNLSGLPSAINIIAKAIESTFLPFFAPFAGAFGALLTGSVTASNVMFGTLFNTTALSVGFNQSIILALLVVGAGIGNMIALADILTAEAVIGEKNAERKILKGVIIPCLTCLFIVGIIGIIILK
ncbi:MAG: L-lactate permease [Candidatus Paceibacterota bacterium]|jgi:lactate permease